jgi:predicted nucleic acid-binding protein
MIGRVIVDTGPLIALLDRRDQHHAWVEAQFAEMVPPLLTCEAVLTEACHLAPRTGLGPQAALELLERGVVRLAFDLHDNFVPVSSMVRRYVNVPMSLADACLVRLSELVGDAVVFTLDSDFRVYRRHRRQRIPLVIPPER